MAHRLDTRDPGFAASFRAALEAKREAAADVDREVAEILADVRHQGDGALIAYTERFDRLALAPATLRLDAAEIAAAAAGVAPEQQAALAFAAQRIRAY
ncbi:MAG: histidinol dehydrogenase, partial [Alphaproteobacteria bacterium]|nr:histidinol dehydrogenase [Alphaproteobacteria bacterium]